jgi:hypothetical protein
MQSVHITANVVSSNPAQARWFSLDIPVSSTNKTDRHGITQILLKVALNTITLTLTPMRLWKFNTNRKGKNVQEIGQYINKSCKPFKHRVQNILKERGDVIVWCLNLQISIQSVPITTNVVSSNPVQARCTQYNIMW